MIIYANLQSNLSISFRGEDFQSFCFWVPWQPEFCMDLLHLNNFDRFIKTGLTVTEKMPFRELCNCNEYVW